MISLSWNLLSLYSSSKVPGRTWPQCFSRARAAGAGLVDPLHPSTLSFSSWANRANCVLLEGPCWLWAGFGDLQGSLLLLMHQRGCSPTQDMQRASCECLSAQPGPGLWHMGAESQGLGCCGSCDLLRSTCLHKWRTWSISGTSLSSLFLLKCLIQGTLEPLFSPLLAEAGQEDIQACSS